MTVLGIKAHLKAPTAVDPRHCEAAAAARLGWGRADLGCRALPSPLRWCGERRFLLGLASSRIRTALGRNFHFSSTTKEDVGADTFLVYDT